MKLAFMLALIVAAACGQSRPVVLFDGSHLDHWQKGPANWRIIDGILTLVDRSDGEEHNDNYLWTREQYGDFILELEYRVPAGRANSGVFLRTADIIDPVYTGIEVQVGNINPDRPPGRGSVGGIYDLVAPSKVAHKPGQWNKYVITCRGAHIKVELNGELTAEAELDRWTETGKNPDGSPNKFKRPMKDFARRGYIGLQDHGLPVEYRNIRVTPLGK